MAGIPKDKLISKEKLGELEATHGRIAYVRGKEDPDGSVPWEVVLRKPRRPEVKEFRARSHNPAQVADAQELLLRKLAVYPDLAQVDAWLEDGWALGEACGPAFNRLMGLQAELVEEAK